MAKRTCVCRGCAVTCCLVMNPESSKESSAPRPQANTTGTDLESRMAAAERYLATQEDEAPSCIKVAGGTVVRVPLFGGVRVSPEAASRVGLLAVGGLVVFGVLVFCFRRHFGVRHER